jgi:hypothetical protein
MEDRIADLDKQLQEQRAENERQRVEIAKQHADNEQQRAENARQKQRIKELEEALKAYADGKAAKAPKIPLNYSSARNEPPEKTPKKQQSEKEKKRKQSGRKRKDTKSSHSDQVIDLLPEGLQKSDCILHHEQFVWRLIEHRATYVHYRVYAPAGATELPIIPGVRNAKCGYGIEFILMLAHHVYWMGLSMDKARKIICFHTGVDIPKSQVDSLLYQLSSDWKQEYVEIAKRIAVASILYIDETGWKIGKRHCYTWVFGTFADVYYKVGVGRGKDEMENVIGKMFAGTGVSDNYGAYNTIFTKHQLCWAHFLRKAIELMLRYPTNKAYRSFYLRLLLIYRQAKRYREDDSLTMEDREAKALELQDAIVKLCTRAGEEIITEKRAEENKLDKSLITSIPEATMIRLQNELVSNLDCLFVFVENPAVDGTNNQSERDLRREAQVRKAGNTSKSDKGALRRATIISVFASLARRITGMTLTTIMEVVEQANQLGVSLFNIAKTPDTKLLE